MLVFFRRLVSGYLSFDFGSFRVFLALFCAICGLFTPKVEVSGKEGKIPLSCSELFLTKRSFVVGFSWLTVYYLYYLTGGCVVNGYYLTGGCVVIG